MSDIEKQIKEQRLLLDSDRPRKGHEDRFRQKLERLPVGRPVRRIRFRHAIQVAASVALILTSAIVLVKKDNRGSKVAQQEIPAAVMEADVYYASEVDARYEEISGIDFGDAEEKALLLKELKDLENYHQQLMKDLKANPNDDRVLSALIRHYQLKLEVLDQIIAQLNQVKTIISENHEKESI
ncbi:MAG: hypothetical protein P1P86_03560 [Bacteroidales bacterium]|nr:hypothetical protein [Bacteroidales bacterium]